MLEITIPAVKLETFDERTNKFVNINIKETTLRLEHSLVSLSKWESKWCKPFLKKEQKTQEETIDYVKCMTLTQNVDPMVYKFISADNFKKISDYIESQHTATYIRDIKGKKSREPVTSELIYYWMISLNIPFECQKWHLNRLLTLIKVCSMKNQPPKKMSKSAILAQNDALNEQRLKQLKTKG